MGRKLRYIPDGGGLVEVTSRTLHGRPLLRPSRELNDITAGILGRAQRLYPVDLVAFVSASKRVALLGSGTFSGQPAGAPHHTAASREGALKPLTF